MAENTDHLFLHLPDCIRVVVDIVEVNLGFTSCSAICNEESLSGDVLDRFGWCG